jgi:hemolysin type calcium-binding protein
MVKDEASRGTDRTARRRRAATVAATVLVLVPLTSGAGVPRPAAAARCTIVGTARADVLRGTARADVICGGGGNDTIYGRGGNDTIYGGRGADQIWGGAGRDQLLGGAKADRISGGPGNDVIYGGAGRDVLNGSGGADTVNGEAGPDWLYGGGGNDRVLGGSGNDRLWGGAGNDRLEGEDGNDWYSGGPGSNTILRDSSDGASYVLDFTSPSDVGKLQLLVHHRNLISYPKGHDSHGTWSGDHDLHCGPPDTQRVVHAVPQHEAFWHCREHFMTGMGDIDGYSIIGFSPKRSFSNATRVCWDVNLTDLLRRKWVSVHLIPESAWTGDFAYREEALDNPSTAATLPNGAFSWSNFNDESKLLVGDDEVFDGLEFNAGDDKATRFEHCMTDHRNGTVTFRQERPNGGSAQVTVRGSFPDRFRVAFLDHSYTPTKDGTPIGFTWHWDTIVVR